MIASDCSSHGKRLKMRSVCSHSFGGGVTARSIVVSGRGTSRLRERRFIRQRLVFARHCEKTALVSLAIVTAEERCCRWVRRFSCSPAKEEHASFLSWEVLERTCFRIN
ncbi:hypothetical protein AVEN_175670-1 [Araneus ventricosus]|uniref:Uncharacterized protein n=1 Tax=Araneus ventricosus TaxID=182803 RepID=A0A4Y2V8R6_ARAVE|nr:hypothetical protein AVEN_175670-1 [Araneus ventricosus]